MPRRNIGQLPKPRPGYRADRFDPPEGKKPFETITGSAVENGERGRRMLATAKRMPQGKKRQRAIRLAKELLRSGEERKAIDSLACALSVRDFRLRLIGALGPVIIEGPPELEVAFVTIIPKGWEVPAGKLHKQNPRQMLKAFRAALYRCGATKADGWLIVFIHGEFEPGRGVYQLHLHGFASGGMIDVLGRLRTKPKYRGDQSGDVMKEARVERRVQIKRKLNHLVHLLGYIYQPFWPQRWIGTVQDPDGTEREIRQRGKVRIAEPQHSEILLWLDRWEPQDLGLLIHLGVTSAGLKYARAAGAPKSKTYTNARSKAGPRKKEPP